MITNLFDTSQALSIGLAQSFAASLWEGAALAVFVWIGLRLLPRTSASTRFAAWSIAFAALILLPLAAFLPSQGQPVAAAVVPAQSSGYHVDPRWAFVIAAAWLLCSAGRFASLVWNSLRLRLLWRTSEPVQSSAEFVNDPAIRAALSARSTRPIEIRLSDRVNAPCAIGFFTSAILIPRWLWQKLTPAELHQIVLHESAHLRRYDDWTNLLQKLAIVVFPLNPALLWMERQLCLEREMACDDAVLSAAVSPRTYAACLAGLAEKKLLRRTTSLAPGAWSRQSELVRRVHGILSRNRNSSPIVARSVAVACLVATLGGAAVLSRAPQMISFAPLPSTVEAAAMDLPALPTAPHAPKFVAAKFVLPAAAPRTRELRASAPAHKALRHAVAVPAVSAPIPVEPATEIATSAPPALPAALPPAEIRQVGILQSPLTGQSWVVLAIWRSAPVAPDSSNPGASNSPQSPAGAPVVTHFQTGWILIQI
jgi:beta-lactamase regulating signal transducer with metallopeptidase domain